MNQSPRLLFSGPASCTFVTIVVNRLERCDMTKKSSPPLVVIAMIKFYRLLGLCLLGISVTALQYTAVAQNPAGRPVKYATEYDWSMSPTAELSQAGAGTVSLASCPPGVKGNEPEYWVLINGSEPARVTGGTCAGDGRSGTLQFAGKRSHAPGETLSSASGGLQEAIIAAR